MFQYNCDNKLIIIRKTGMFCANLGRPIRQCPAVDSEAEVINNYCVYVNTYFFTVLFNLKLLNNNITKRVNLDLGKNYYIIDVMFFFLISFKGL